MIFSIENTVVVDIQFLVGNNNHYYAKELVFLFSDSTTPIHHHIKQPHSEHELSNSAKQNNNYLLNFINGLDWTAGDVDYNNLDDIFQTISSYSIIVKGYAKKQFLAQYLPTNKIIDLSANTSLKNMYDRYHNCPIHDRSYSRCAVNNVHKIMYFMIENKMFHQ